MSLESNAPPTGVLLLQLGTPDSTDTADVRRYLREFLGDPRVLDIPAPLRMLLLYGAILPFRPRRSAEAYEKIWTEDGSPLLIHTAELAAQVAERLGPAYHVEFGMRYGKPSIAAAVDRLETAGVRKVVVLPLFPQYASASGGSATQAALEQLAQRWNVPDVVTTSDFYDHPGFVHSVAEVAGPLLAQFEPDFVLFSYHGLPERQVRKSDLTGAWCLQRPDCCDRIVDANRSCYRAQCFATTRAVVDALGLDPETTATSFQSRLAGPPWIRPYTDKVLPDLAARGVRRLAVLTPSFVADCLETLEEIGIRGRDQWRSVGGEELALIPCVNTSPAWVQTVADLVAKSA